MRDADAGRHQVAERGLTPAAVGALIPLMGAVAFEARRLAQAPLDGFFSNAAWTAMDAAALADAVGPRALATGAEAAADVDVIRHPLDDDLELIAGWVDGRFVLDVEVADAVAPPASSATSTTDLGSTF